MKHFAYVEGPMLNSEEHCCQSIQGIFDWCKYQKALGQTEDDGGMYR